MNPGQLAKAIALFFKQTPTQRDATAQMRAALPVEQGGLGLPPDNEFYDRANVMFPRTVYRGVSDPSVFDEPVELTKDQMLRRAFNRYRDYPRAGNSYREDSSVFTAPSELVARTYGPTTKFRLNDEGFGYIDFEGRNYSGLDFDHTKLSDTPSEIAQEIDRGDSVLEDYAADIPIIDAAGDQIAVIYRATTDKIGEVVGDPEMLDEYGESLLPDVDLPGVRIDNIIDINDGRAGMSAADKRRVVQPSIVYISKPNRLRRATASFDPFLKDWDNIFAGSGAVGVGILLDQLPTDEEKQGALYADGQR